MIGYSSSVGSRSELVAKAVWFLYVFTFKKIPSLGKKSHFETMLESIGMTKEEFIYDAQKNYLKFLKTKKPF